MHPFVAQGHAFKHCMVSVAIQPLILTVGTCWAEAGKIPFHMSMQRFEDQAPDQPLMPRLGFNYVLMSGYYHFGIPGSIYK